MSQGPRERIERNLYRRDGVYIGAFTVNGHRRHRNLKATTLTGARLERAELLVALEQEKRNGDEVARIIGFEPREPLNGTYVYFIGAPLIAVTLVKIGTTANLVKRFQQIRTMSPVPVELLAAIPGDEADESRLHSEFAHLRRHGEWFVLDDTLAAVIDRARSMFGTPEAAS